MLLQKQRGFHQKMLKQARTDVGTPHVMGKPTEAKSPVIEKKEVTHNNASST